jgi:hypothetical protein
MMILLRSDDENGYECRQYYCECYPARTLLAAAYKTQRAVGAALRPLPSHYDKCHGGSTLNWHSKVNTGVYDA